MDTRFYTSLSYLCSVVHSYHTLTENLFIIDQTYKLSAVSENTIIDS
jgi:hypothetical protein